MQPYVTPLIPTKTGFVRLRFPELRDWSGEVHVSGIVGDPAERLVVSVVSDPGSGPPLDVRIEESRDGVNWSESPPRRTRIDVLRERSRRPEADGRDREIRKERRHG